MDTIFATMVCFLLAILPALVQTETVNTTITPVTTTPSVNVTHTTVFVLSSNATAPATVVSNVTEDTTSFTNTTSDTGTVNKTTSRPQTSESTTILTPLTNTTSLTTATPGTHTPTLTALTKSTNQTTAGYISTSATAVTTPVANSTHTVNTTLDAVDRVTQGLKLNTSEKNMTIVFSVALGVFAVLLVLLMFHKCKHKIQYMHQPLNNTDNTDAFVADDDTLVISGGLYDEHPIYDNIPTVQEDQSQFRLEFLH